MKTVMTGNAVRTAAVLIPQHFGYDKSLENPYPYNPEKARQLLADTDEKITTIALESGYRHLGFFNAMFKKKFGVTPSEWRRSNTRMPPVRKRIAKCEV